MGQGCGSGSNHQSGHWHLKGASAYPTSGSSFDPTVQSDHEMLSDTNPTLPPNPSSPQHHPSLSNTSTTPLQQVQQPDITTRNFQYVSTLEDLIRTVEIQLEISQTKINRVTFSKVEPYLKRYLSIEENY
ncbi:hypothetical protein H5410_031462 [Solanum commersonii]|uniref:Uncharacterized protein n=1 Tax=Solanum commersonii TaxID=4109 RepID=A0A9J5YLS3_SOLCO|nr:hypothetical protein H5410_031462 [Solanum commersonii]